MYGQRPMDAWMKFYIYWRFPLFFVFGAIAMLTAVVSEVPVVPPKAEVLYYVYNLLYIGVYVFSINVYGNMKKLNETGYEQNNVLLALEVIVQGVYRAVIFGFLGFLMQIVIGGLVWFLPNFIYFKKRRALFQSAAITAEDKNRTVCDFVCASCKKVRPSAGKCPWCGETEVVSVPCRTGDGGYDLDSLAQQHASAQKPARFKCVACGQERPATGKCPHCGSAVKVRIDEPDSQPPARQAAASVGSPNIPAATGRAESAFCTNCGEPLTAGEQFCRRCGNRVEP